MQPAPAATSANRPCLQDWGRQQGFFRDDYVVFGWDVEYGGGKHSPSDRKVLLAMIDKLCCASTTRPSGTGNASRGSVPKKAGKVVVLLHDHNHRASKGGRQPLEDFLQELKKRRGYAFETLSSY